MEYIVKNIQGFNDNDIESFYERIPKNKRDKINKIKNSNARKRSIVGEILLSKLLTKNNLSYDNLEYYINDYGKPYLKNNNLFFNISHSFDYVIAIVSEKEIGIDIEKLRKTSLNTIHQFATKKEQDYILSSNINIEERIFSIYTLKEAYIKMLGTNLNKAFDVEFQIINNTVICSDKNVKVGFLNDIEGYVIAYCERI